MTRSLQCTVCAVLSTVMLTAVAQPEPAATRFDVWEYQVEGAQLLDTMTIERTVYGHLGPELSIDDVEAARSDLEAAFRDAGYGTVIVNIPEQDVENGVVRLQVIEGKIERMRVSGSRYFSLGRIRSRVPALAEGQVPYLPDVQKQLAQVNRASPDRVVTPALRPGHRPGAVEVELKVKDQLPVHGAIDFNDQYSRDTTRTRLNVSLRYDNLWQREHSLGVAYQLTPEDPSEVKVLSGTYLMRPAWTDALIALYAVKSDSDVLTLSGAGGGVGVLGRGVITGARFVKPLPIMGTVFHNLSLGLDYKDFEDTVSPQGDDGFVTPISYAKFVAGYGGFVTLDTTTVNYNLETNFGVRAFGNTEKEFENKRFQAKPNFIFLRLNTKLDRPWIRGSKIVLVLSGQVASGAIVSNEQFSLGGAETVRGYVETQVLADDALQASFELLSPSLHRYTGVEWFSDLRLFVFGDAGHARILDPLPEQPGETSLASVGLGLEFATPLGIDSTLAWAYPLVRNGDIRPGESRLHVGFAYEF